MRHQLDKPAADLALDLLEAHGVRIDETLMWTQVYHPFRIGDLWADAGAVVPCDRPILYRGIFLALCRGPEGLTKVVHFDSGAIVGDTLEEAMRDIDEGDPELVDQQMQMAMQRRQNIQQMSAEELWSRLAKAARNREAA